MGGDPFDEIQAEEEPEQVKQMESSSKGKVKGSNALNYFRASSNWCVLGMLAVLFVLAQLFASGADYWVSYFTKEEELRAFKGRYDNSLAQPDDEDVQIVRINNTRSEDETAPLLSTDMCLYIHGALMLGLWVFSSIR